MTTRAKAFLRVAAVFGFAILSATLCYSQYSGNVQGFVVDNNMANIGAFGTVHSALSGRQIQLGARISF